MQVRSCKLFEADGNDNLFNALKSGTSPMRKEAKDFIQRLFEKTYLYLDRNLANDLRNQFHQRFWEMYLVAALLDTGKELERSRCTGPDICIESVNLPKIWIEAIAPQSGSGVDAVQEVRPRVVSSVPDDKIQLRLLNAFDEKFRKFKKYIGKNLVSCNEPCVIAINAALVPLARPDDDDVPRIVRSLLPIGNPVVTISRHTLEIISCGYTYKPSISKASGAQVPTTAFLDPEYSFISAVIYSDVDVLNHPQELGRALLLFHNPLAKNPLPLGFLKCGCEYWVENDELKDRNWNEV